MAYKISQPEENRYSIDFKFTNQSAKVDVEKQDTRRLYVNSLTDGYHWLQFWMAQEPGAAKIQELPHEQERTRVSQSLSAQGFVYTPESKETCFLDTEENVTREIIDRLAKYLDPRFALRERFF
jgi:hypothetical protein